MLKKWTILTILLLTAMLSDAQQYCGEYNRFLFEVVNDSLAKGAFLKDFEHDMKLKTYDIHLSKRGDTTFLNLNRPHRLTWSVITQAKAEEVLKNQSGKHVIVKCFIPNYRSVSPDYLKKWEGVYLMDTHSHQIILPYKLIPDDYIFVVNAWGCVRTFVPKNECPHEDERLLLDLSGVYSPIGEDSKCLFDNFPIRITNDSIIPLNKEKNFECWIENGFRFPDMHRKTPIERSPFEINVDAYYKPQCYLIWFSDIGYEGLLELRKEQRLIIEPENGYYRYSVDDVY